MLIIKLEDYTEVYQKNIPPHVVIDDAFLFSHIDQIEKCFPKPGNDWWIYDNPLEKKFAFNCIEQMPEPIVEVIHYLNSRPFIDQLEKLTGITGLIADPFLNGGGLHQIARGGKLDIHADYNYHPVTKLDRRLNVLLYLNRHWQEEWGGHLEFWDPEMTYCMKKISPLFNRLVIFSTTDQSFHGHPDPLNCPEDRTRKSIALYYYTWGRPSHEKSPPHSTLFKRRPQDPIVAEIEELRIARGIKRL